MGDENPYDGKMITSACQHHTGAFLLHIGVASPEPSNGPATILQLQMGGERLSRKNAAPDFLKCPSVRSNGLKRRHWPIRAQTFEAICL